jgi:hypothetical protein
LIRHKTICIDIQPNDGNDGYEYHVLMFNKITYVLMKRSSYNCGNNPIDYEKDLFTFRNEKHFHRDLARYVVENKRTSYHNHKLMVCLFFPVITVICNAPI